MSNIQRKIHVAYHSTYRKLTALVTRDLSKDTRKILRKVSDRNNSLLYFGGYKISGVDI